jgi:hypothetical protein
MPKTIRHIKVALVLHLLSLDDNDFFRRHNMRKLWMPLMFVALLVPSTGWAATNLTLDGSSSSEVGKIYTLGLAAHTFANPPEVYIDWGNDTNSGWFMPNWTQPMGDAPWGSNVPYVYSSPGVYTIKAKNRSPNDMIESDWSYPITVSVIQSSGDIIGALEGPSGTVSGVQTIYGWALALRGISKVELYISDQYIGRIAYGGSRQDIKSQYPDYPSSEYSGFVTEYNFSASPTLTPIIKIRAYDQDGLFKDITTTNSVTVKKFHGNFVTSMIQNQASLNLNRVTTSDGVTKKYRVVIEWSNESQGFEIIDIKQIGR